jgi:diphosphomevalonate decarboxylase
MRSGSATAMAHPNIAFIKYWGNKDNALRIPANGSISMTLDQLYSKTTVNFDPLLVSDEFVLDGQKQEGPALERVSEHLSRVRQMADIQSNASVESVNNFPARAGIASSASGFAALTLAACTSAGLELDKKQLSILARKGSGSASRSISGGFVEWYTGEDDHESFAEQIAPPEHWDLIDLIAIVQTDPKHVGSTAGHALATTSPLQPARIDDTERRLAACRQAIRSKNFGHLAATIEQDSNMMHSVMLTCTPPLIYWSAATLSIMQAVAAWRNSGKRVAYTIDAGPNVHCICPADSADKIRARLEGLPGVKQVIFARAGGPAKLITTT